MKYSWKAVEGSRLGSDAFCPLTKNLCLKRSSFHLPAGSQGCLFFCSDGADVKFISAAFLEYSPGLRVAVLFRGSTPLKITCRNYGGVAPSNPFGNQKPFARGELLN